MNRWNQTTHPFFAFALLGSNVIKFCFISAVHRRIDISWTKEMKFHWLKKKNRKKYRK